MVFLPFLDTIEVHDGEHFLRMRLQVADQPCAVGIWRNLGGWPESDPYRSIGVEPMLGQRTGLATAPEGHAAQVPSSGVVEWTLDITAGSRRADRNTHD